MKFSTIFTIFATAAVTVSVGAETNAQRFARGLPPLQPAKRATPVRFDRRGYPSSTPTPTPCKQGSGQCCQAVYHHNDPEVKYLAGLLYVDVKLFKGLTGQHCTPLTSWCEKPLCCEYVYSGGLVVTGCKKADV